MMKSNWIPTNEFYHRIIDAPDVETRHKLYMELLVQPWKPMMDMMARTFGGEQPDPLAGARAWAWLLPEQVETMAAILEKMEAANAWKMGGEALAIASERFDKYAPQIPFDTVTGWLALADPARSISMEGGYTGATDWTRPWFLGQFWDPNDYNLPRLGGLMAHEMHHLIRMRAFPFDMQKTSVADYIVIEGTAESFATSLFGEDKLGFYVTGIDEKDFETAKALIGKGLHNTGFNVIRSYIFGDALAERSGYTPLGGMPTYGGYAIGYRMVQAYLNRTGKTIEETTFISADEIVAGSGFWK